MAVANFAGISLKNRFACLFISKCSRSNVCVRYVDMPNEFISSFVRSCFEHTTEGDIVGRESNSKCHSGNHEQLGGELPLYIPFSPSCRPQERGSKLSAMTAARGKSIPRGAQFCLELAAPQQRRPR